MTHKHSRHGRRGGDDERREWIRLGLEITLTAWRTALAVWSALHQ